MFSLYFIRLYECLPPSQRKLAGTIDYKQSRAEVLVVQTNNILTPLTSRV